MRRTALMLLVVLAPASAIGGEPPGEKQVLEWLQELEPLPKVHYSWPVPYDSISDEILSKYVRLTHAASVSGEWHNRDEVDRAVRVCRQVNRPIISTTRSKLAAISGRCRPQSFVASFAHLQCKLTGSVWQTRIICKNASVAVSFFSPFIGILMKRMFFFVNNRRLDDIKFVGFKCRFQTLTKFAAHIHHNA